MNAFRGWRVSAGGLVVALGLIIASSVILSAAAGPVAPPPCQLRYPGESATDPRDDVPCADNMTHVFTDTFLASGLDIERTDAGDRLYVGSRTEGFRIYSLEDPARPELIAAYNPEPAGFVTELDAEKFGHTTINTVAITTGETPEPSGVVGNVFPERVEFVDVTGDDPQLLATLHGDAHNGILVEERGWFLPSDYGDDSGDKADDLEIYDIDPVLKAEPIDPPPDCFPPDDPRSRDNSESCPKVLFSGDLKQLWAESPHRGEEPVLVEVQDVVSIYEAVLGDKSTPPGVTPGHYALVTFRDGGVMTLDITDPTAPVALNLWRSESRESGVIGYHKAEMVEDDPTLMVVADESTDASGSRSSGIHFVRLSEDLTDATEIAHYDGWLSPLLSPLDTTGVEPASPLDYKSSEDKLFVTTRSAATWIVDFSPLRGVTTPIRSESGVPLLSEYFEIGEKPELGHYIPDQSGGVWRIDFSHGHELHLDEAALDYSGGGAFIGVATASGLDVFEYVHPRKPKRSKPKPSPTKT